MVPSRCILFASCTVFASASLLLTEDQTLTSLLKRQQSGTPSYNCHDNCGTAITISKAGGDICTNEAFLFDYSNCLSCSGPDNFNIWRYYSRSLIPVAEQCGLETTPLSGKQEGPPEAMHLGDASASSSVMTPTPTPSASAESVVSEAVSVTEEMTAPIATPEVTPVSATSTMMDTPTLTDAIITAPTGMPSPSSNGTASFTASAPIQQSENVGGHVDIGSGVLGAMIFGLMYGFGN